MNYAQLDLPIEDLEQISPEIRTYLRPGDTQGFLEALKLSIEIPWDKVTTTTLSWYMEHEFGIKGTEEKVSEYIATMQERDIIPSITVLDKKEFHNVIAEIQKKLAEINELLETLKE